MGKYVTDAGSRYIVKDERLEEAYAWLEDAGEFAFVVGHGNGTTHLGANGYEEMFCGEMADDFHLAVEAFMALFCEPGSYACFCYDNHGPIHMLIWKDELIHNQAIGSNNPFASKIADFERRL